MIDKPQIFLSYAREDEAKVKALYRKLTKAGFSTWMDTQNILPGQRWQYEIKGALRRSELVLVCLSFVSVEKRGFLQKEIKEALEHLQEKLESDIYLIPVRLDNCQVPESLSNVQWVDLFAEDGWDRLMRAIATSLRQAQDSKKKVVRPSQAVDGATAPRASELTIRITSPHNYAQVDCRTSIEGLVTDRYAYARVWVIVHPMDESCYWVQPSVNVREDGTWKVRVYIGRQSIADVGKHFEVVAVANPESELHEGMILDQFPIAQRMSQVVEITRQNDEQSYLPSQVAGPQRSVTIQGSVKDGIVVAGDKNKIEVIKGCGPKKS